MKHPHSSPPISRDSDIELTDNEEEFHYTEVDNTSKSITTMTRHFAAMNTYSPMVSIHTDTQTNTHTHTHTHTHTGQGELNPLFYF